MKWPWSMKVYNPLTNKLKYNVSDGLEDITITLTLISSV